MTVTAIYSLLHVCAHAVLDKKTDATCVADMLEVAAEELWKIVENKEG